MADIFLSYAREDLDRVSVLAGALQTLGWSVWWDRTIRPGRSWDQVLEGELDSARCIVVAWSKSSVGSDWVRSEAEEGTRRQILIPVLIDEVRVPLAFRRIQGADLTGWNGHEDHAGFRNLQEAVAELLARPPATTSLSPSLGPTPETDEDLDEVRPVAPPAGNPSRLGADAAQTDAVKTPGERPPKPGPLIPLSGVVLSVVAAIATIAIISYVNPGKQEPSPTSELLAKIEKLEKDIAARPAAPAAAARPQIDPNKVYEIPVASSAVRGPRNAPVTITMFSDFQCPFCAQSIPIMEEVLKAYPKDVNFVMKQFPLRQIHPNAQPAAQAALAARNQGKFWEMHDELFKNGRNLTPETIKGIAEKLGLDLQKWEADMISDDVKKEIDGDLALGAKSDVRGTPSFFVNGKYSQNRSVDGFKTQIDAELKAKGKGS